MVACSPNTPPRPAGAGACASPGRGLIFAADHAALKIQGELSKRDQIRYIGTGSGFLSPSRDCLANIVERSEALGIHDEDCVSLLQSVDAQLSIPKEEPT